MAGHAGLVTAVDVGPISMLNTSAMITTVLRVGSLAVNGQSIGIGLNAIFQRILWQILWANELSRPGMVRL
jgi:hypothetical protein